MKIYGKNYKDLLEIRAKYDPKRRFKGHVKIGSSSITTSARRVQ